MNKTRACTVCFNQQRSFYTSVSDNDKCAVVSHGWFECQLIICCDFKQLAVHHTMSCKILKFGAMLDPQSTIQTEPDSKVNPI